MASALIGIGLSAASSMFKASQQKAEQKRAKKAQSRYFRQQREAVGTPEQYEPGFYESFMREEEPRLAAWAASRGLTRSSDVERQQAGLQVRGREAAKRAALERWKAQAPYGQAAAEGAYGTAYEAGPKPEEALWGGMIKGAGETIGGWVGEKVAPVVSEVTPGIETPSVGGGDYFAEQDPFAWV